MVNNHDASRYSYLITVDNLRDAEVGFTFYISFLLMVAFIVSSLLTTVRYIAYVLGIVACFFSASPLLNASDGAAADDELIVIQLKWRHQFQFAGFYAALEQGFFADEGLRVELRERDPSQNIIDLVLDKEVHYGISDSVLLLHAANEVPIILVAAIMQQPVNALMTMANSHVRHPKDLLGRRISFYENDSDGLDILALLAEQGIHRSQLIRRNWDSKLDDLIAGNVDAVSIYTSNEPFRMREMGHEVNIIYPQHFGISLYGDILFTHRDEAQQNPERVAAIRRAVIRGWHYALDNKEELVELILEQYNSQQKSRAALLYEADATEAVIARRQFELGYLDAARVDFIVRQMQRLNLLDRDFSGRERLIFRGQTNYALVLTDEERDFIESLPAVRFAAEVGGWPPLEILRDDGSFEGIAADYLHRLSDILGIQFEVVAFNDWQEILAAVKKHEVDLLPAAVSTPDRRQFLNFTAPYVRSPSVVVTRTERDFVADLNLLINEKIGVVDGYASDEMISHYYPHILVQRYSYTEVGLLALASGEIDYFVENLAVASHIIKSQGLSNLKIAGQTPYTFDLSFGIRQDWPLLASALDKALASMTAQEHADIYQRWVQLKMTQQFDLKRLWFPAFIIVLVIVLLMIYLQRLRTLNRVIQIAHNQLEQAEQRLREKNALLEQVSITDKLTGVFNRHHLDQILSDHFAHAKRYERHVSVVIFDLDHFKEVNDTYGHQVGDHILQAFPQTVMGCIRNSDVFGRWGGEEFLLICPETDTDQAVQVAEKIRTQFAHLTLAGLPKTTVSAGVADDSNAETLHELIGQADKQLYAAKSAGRNQVHPLKT